MSTILYTKNGSNPAKPPWRIRLSDGSTRTDPNTFTDEMIADAGYIEAPAKPEEIEGKIIVWSNGMWVQVDAPIEETPVE